MRDWSTMTASQEFIATVLEGSLMVNGFASPAAVMQFYSNGNVLQYVDLHPEVEIAGLVRQMAVALMHIHANGVEHGNFCPVTLRPGSLEL